MRRTLALVGAFTRDILGSPPLTALFAAIVLIVTAFDAAIVGRLALTPAITSGDEQAVGAIVGIAAFFAAFVAAGIAFAVLLVVPLTRQKANGVLVALLATPAGARRVWWTRSVALWLPSLGASIIAAGGVMFSLTAWSMPATMALSLPGWTVAATVLAVPSAYLALSLVVNAVGLTASPNAANAIGIAYYAGGSAMIGNVMARAGLGPQGLWWLTVALAVVTCVAALALVPRVHAQRVVLS